MCQTVWFQRGDLSSVDVRLGFIPYLNLDKRAKPPQRKNNFTSLKAGLKTPCCFNVIYINKLVSNTSPPSLTPTGHQTTNTIYIMNETFNSRFLQSLQM